MVTLAEKKAAFIEAFAETGRNDIATKRVGIPYTTPNHWARHDEEFKKAWDQARVDAAQLLEDAAVRRSTKGVRRPIFYKGELQGFERHYSDTLTMFLLKGIKPQVYREHHSHEVTGKGGGPVETQVTHGLSDEAAELIRKKILGVK